MRFGSRSHVLTVQCGWFQGVKRPKRICSLLFMLCCQPVLCCTCCTELEQREEADLSQRRRRSPLRSGMRQSAVHAWPTRRAPVGRLFITADWQAPEHVTRTVYVRRGRSSIEALFPQESAWKLCTTIPCSCARHAHRNGATPTCRVHARNAG